VYNYDEFFDFAGYEGAYKRGYDIQAFLKEFSRWGFVCVVPLERYHKINAIKGALFWAKQQSFIKPNKLHLIGLSEGAFLGLMSQKEVQWVSSITLIAPVSIYQTGAFSLDGAKKIMPNLKVPVLYMIAEYDRPYRLGLTYELYKVFQVYRKDVTFKQYSENRKWFWDPTHSFMNDIHIFLTGRQRKEPKSHFQLLDTEG